MNKNKSEKVFNFGAVLNPPKRGAWKVMLPILLVLIIGGAFAHHYDLDIKTTAAIATLIAFSSGVVAWLLAIVAMVPVVGPLVVKVLTMSFIWLLNAIGYLVSYIAIRRGYSKDVITYRIVTFALLAGIVIGFVIGSLVS